MNGFTTIHSHSPANSRSDKFAAFDSELQGRNKTSRKLQNNTYLKRVGEDIAVRLHATDIILLKKDGTIIVTSGGWKTPTTKERLNSYLPAGFNIWQKKGTWYWSGSSVEGQIVYTDGDKLVPQKDGGYKLSYQSTPTDEKKIAKLRKEINAFAAGAVAAMPLDMPGAGDCFMCMAGEHGGTDHLLSHIKERYYVPRLVWDAIKEAGAGQLYFAAAFDKNETGEWITSLRKNTKRWIARYLCRRLGLPK